MRRPTVESERAVWIRVCIERGHSVLACLRDEFDEAASAHPSLDVEALPLSEGGLGAEAGECVAALGLVGDGTGADGDVGFYVVLEVEGDAGVGGEVGVPAAGAGARRRGRVGRRAGGTIFRCGAGGRSCGLWS